jgi:site-specific DNA-methyltransferase (adenine-specific)
MNKLTPAPRNRTLTVSDAEFAAMSALSKWEIMPKPGSILMEWEDRIFLGEMENVTPALPSKSVNLLILDPPYNLRRDFGNSTFRPVSGEQYATLFSDWLARLSYCLTDNATIYVCSDWRTSAIIFPILDQHFNIRNRITWEREKGRGSTTNWKSTGEDIWYCTRSDDFKFYPDRVKLRREVIAPYRDEAGKPKDWVEASNGAFRDTSPSNLWTDLTVPFWSMPENTDHPTQKPEKLIAKLILASSDEGDVVLDPFLGSGTTAVVAKKLHRRFVGVEREEDYIAVAQKRLNMTKVGDPIQGYHDGVFWARNTGAAQAKTATVKADKKVVEMRKDLFSL